MLHYVIVAIANSVMAAVFIVSFTRMMQPVFFQLPVCFCLVDPGKSHEMSKGL